jgi:arylsulfatase A-like enzyme
VVEGYTEQLAYIDKLAIAAIDDVSAGVSDDAVVIVMSDHGPDAHVDWDHLQTTDSHERFSNFFAARTPNAPGLFGDAPTPVNIFPTLLDRYLGYSLPRQPDTSFLGVPPRDELTAIDDPNAD